MYIRLKSVLEAYEQVSQDQEKMDNAAATFDDLLQGVGTMQDAEARIDELAASGRLDAPLLLTMAKAYSGVKESPYTKDEVKEVMFHLYMKAKETAARQQPTDVRILKYLLSLDDPKERYESLEEAFKPAPAVPSVQPDKDTTMDFLFTSPDNLLATVEMVLKAYEQSKGKSSLLGQTADIMSVEVIQRLKDIRDYIRKYYM